jgi:hypothetical protein
LIFIFHIKSFSIFFSPWGILKGVEFIKFLFFDWFFFLNGWILVQLIKIKRFLLTTKNCFLSLNYVVWNVLGTISFLRFLNRSRISHVKIIKEIYLFFLFNFFSKRLFFAKRVILKISEKISDTIIRDWFFLLYLMLRLPNPRKIGEAKSRKLLFSLRIIALIEGVRITYITWFCKWICCFSFRPPNILKLREIQAVFWLASDLCRKY